MISIQSGMLVALGFLIASLLALLLASAFWSRAVRLTTRRLKQSMPVSEPEIRADLDRLRANYAIKVHKLETQLDHAKIERARHLIEINRRDASISALETDVVAIKVELDENLNARRVLEQTVADRLPKVEARLSEAKRLLFNRDREIADLAQGAKRHKAALEEASSINAQRSAEIDRLNTALATRGTRRRRAPSEAGSEGEASLRAETEALKTKTREQAALIDRLQRRLGEGYVIPTAVGPGSTNTTAPLPQTTEGQIDRLRESIADAETVLHLARTGAPTLEKGRLERDRELRTLRARMEDQAGEIARLKAALAAFEQPQGDGASLRNSRLALKARAGSAEAQAERQAATIARLRAELAAAHERLAQQAAHFMEEMRLIGTVPASGQARRPARDEHRRRLAERVAQLPRKLDAVSQAAPPPKPEGKPDGAGEPDGEGKPGGAAKVVAANGSQGQQKTDGEAAAAAPAPATAELSRPAADLPKTAELPKPQTAPPEGRRKVRLLDLITGMGKG